MDANGLKFWILAEPGHWRTDAGTDYDLDSRRLRLASQRVLPSLPEVEAPGARALAEARLTLVPQTLDSYNTRAYWDGTRRVVMATGAVASEVPIFVPTGDGVSTDLAMGYDGVLYMAIAGQVVLLDRRNRWAPVHLLVDGFEAWRLAADPEGGVWVLDRAHGRIGRVQGLPFPDRPYGPFSPDTVRPCEENPDPPRLLLLDEATWPADETPAGIACSPRGRVALLTWDAAGHGLVRCLAARGQCGPPTLLHGALHPYSLAWVSDDRIAVLLPALASEAPVYAIAEGGQAVEPMGDFHPLSRHNGEPFLNGVTLPPHYPTNQGSAPLYPLSLPSYVATGEASNGIVLDGGDPQTVWHRLYLEAVIPARCGVRVLLATSRSPLDAVPPDDWQEHQFGELYRHAGRPGLPRGAWVSSPSEIPYHPGVLGCPLEENCCGLFTALVQRSNRAVRTLSGRFLQVRVVLQGDGRTTPEIGALRVYASRFSYLNRYLPALYQETLFGDDADALIPTTQRSTPPDFLERFLDNFEGVLTPLEDRIANAYLLTSPQAAPEEAMEWLGSWIGLAFDPAYPVTSRRRLLQEAHILYWQRGTVPGLARGLNIATGDKVARGHIVILENFRLRRTFATILGADLADADDPLLAGVVNSGNSYVGDTLFLGDDNRQEFLALFGADLPTSTAEQDAIVAFLDALAFQATVLVHEDVGAQELGLIRRVVELETPAHVLVRVLQASHPFIVGVAALVGVDTYLRRKPGPEPVRVEQSHIGRRDFIRRPASLDPRLEGGLVEAALLHLIRPSADAGPDLTVGAGETIALDAGNSRAAQGRHVERYIWTWLQ